VRRDLFEALLTIAAGITVGSLLAALAMMLIAFVVGML